MHGKRVVGGRESIEYIGGGVDAREEGGVGVGVVVCWDNGCMVSSL